MTSRLTRAEYVVVGVVLATIVAMLVFSDQSVPSSVWVQALLIAPFLWLHATGIVLVHRTHGFLNFAQIAMGHLGGMLFGILAKSNAPSRWLESVCPPCIGDQPVPWLDFGLSLALGLLVSGAGGWLLYVGVIRRFRSAPRLVPTVATIFVVQLVIGLREPLVNFFTTVQQRADGALNGPVTPPAVGSTRIAGYNLLSHEFLFVLVAVSVVVGGGIALRRTSYGAALRASAERPERAQTLGVDVLRVHQRLWFLLGLASGVGSVANVIDFGLVVTQQGVVAVALMPSLAVAVFARFRSIPLAGLGALGIGILYPVGGFVLGGRTLIDAAMLLVIGGLLLARPDDGTRTDEAVTGWQATRDVRPVSALLRDLPEVVRWRRRGVVLVVLLVAALPWVLSPSQSNLATISILYAIVGLSLLVLAGWAGLVSLGQFAFAAVGGWVALATGVPVLLAVPLGALVGAGVAALVGLPALRLRGLDLAVVTLALGVTTSLLLVNPTYLGAVVADDVDKPVVLGLDLDDQRVAFYLALLLLALAIGAITGLRRSRTGRILTATRENEVAVLSLGVSITRARLTAFAVSGAIASAAGVLFTYQQGGVRPEAFAADVSVTLFAYVVMGGLGSLFGPILGFTLFALVSLFASADWLVAFVSGVGGLLLLLTAPGGLTEVAVRGRDAVLRRVASRRRISVPHLYELDDRERAPIRPRRVELGADEVAARRWTLSDQWTVPDPGSSEGGEPELAIATLTDEP